MALEVLLRAFLHEGQIRVGVLVALVVVGEASSVKEIVIRAWSE